MKFSKVRYSYGKLQCRNVLLWQGGVMPSHVMAKLCEVKSCVALAKFCNVLCRYSNVKRCSVKVKLRSVTLRSVSVRQSYARCRVVSAKCGLV